MLLHISMALSEVLIAKIPMYVFSAIIEDALLAVDIVFQAVNVLVLLGWASYVAIVKAYQSSSLWTVSHNIYL